MKVDIFEFLLVNRKEIVSDFVKESNIIIEKYDELPRMLADEMFQDFILRKLNYLIINEFNLNYDEVCPIIEEIFETNHILNFYLKKETYDDSYSNEN